MTRCLRIRVGQTGYLVPAESVGAITLYRRDHATIAHHRVIDARRMAIGGGASPLEPIGEPVAIEWMNPKGRTSGMVLVDDVEGLVEIDGHAVAAMPGPTRGLAVLFDGFWHDSVRSAFLLRLRTTMLASFAERRQLARLLAPLSAVRRHHVDR